MKDESEAGRHRRVCTEVQGDALTYRWSLKHFLILLVILKDTKPEHSEEQPSLHKNPLMWHRSNWPQIGMPKCL